MMQSARYSAVLAALLAASAATAADPAWQLVNPLPVELDLDDVAHANGLYVAVGERGVVLTTTDGVTWQRQASPTGMDLRGVAWRAPLWVAVGAGGTVLTSRDGVAWLERGPVGVHDLEAVASGPHGLVVVGVAGTVATSAEGVRWSVGAPITTARLLDVAWIGDEFAAVGERGVLLTSSNGTTWAEHDSGTDRDLEAVDGRQGVAMALGREWVVLREPGSGWRGREERWLDDARGLALCGETWVAVGKRGRWFVSQDDGGWSWIGSHHRLVFDAVICGETGAVAVGQAGLTAFGHHPEAWTVTSSLVSSSALVLDGVAAGDTGVIAAAVDMGLADALDRDRKSQPHGCCDEVLFSEDGAGWRSVLEVGMNLYGVAAGGGRYVAYGGDEWYGWIWTSDGGLTWTRTWSGGAVVEAMTWDGSRFIAMTVGGLLISLDGHEWQWAPPGPGPLWSRDVASNGRTIVVPSYLGIGTAVGVGAQWVYTEPEAGEVLIAAAWGGRTFVVVGLGGVVLTSADGLDWQRQLSLTDADLWDVVWTGERFVAAGDDGVLLASPDGRRWQRLETGLHGDLYGVAAADRGLVAVGDTGLIQREVSADPSTSPSAALGWQPTVPQAGIAVRFTDLSDGVPTRWSWMLGDGSIVEGPAVTHVYAEPGVYPVVLHAGNDAGITSVMAQITVEPPCVTPGAPFLHAPQRAPSGERYEVSWSDEEADDYLLEEALDPGFVEVVATWPSTGLALSFEHEWAEGDRFFYRVRAENGCWQGHERSAWSDPVEVVIYPVPTSTGRYTTAVPAASGPGLGGSHWSTDVVLHNPGTRARMAALFLLVNGSETGPASVVVVEPGECLRIEDAPRLITGGPASGAVLVGSPHDLVVSGQVSNQRGSERFHHAVPGLVAGPAGSIPLPVGLWRSQGLHTNVGVFSAEPRDAARVRLRAFEDGNLAGFVTWQVSPLGHAVSTDAAASLGLERAAGTLGLVNHWVPSTNRSGRGASWASVVDNASGDAAVWTTREPAASWRVVVREQEVSRTDAWRSVVRGRDHYVAATAGAIYSSVDGREWIEHEVGDPRLGSGLEAVAFNGEQFVAVGARAPQVSVDGESWRAGVWDGPGLYDLVWAGNEWVAVGSTGVVARSPDGLEWTQERVEAEALTAVTWTGERLVAVGGRAVVVGVPGEPWQSLLFPGSVDDVAWSGERLVATGDAVWSSEDGLDWRAEAELTRGRVTWTGDRFLVVGSRVGESPDGLEWRTVSFEPAQGLGRVRDLHWDGSKAVILWSAGRLSWLAPVGPGLIVPSVRSGQGWRTDLTLLNPSGPDVSVVVGRLDPDDGDPVVLGVAGMDSLVVEDVLASVLGLDGEAVLRITPSSPELEVLARTWAETGDGSRGLRAHAFRDDEVITHLEKGLLVGLRQSDEASTRIGVVNPREVPVEVEGRYESQDGTVVHQVELELRPFDHFLIDLGGFGLPDHDCDCIVVQLTTDSLDGAFIAWAVITDAASGDEMLIPAIRRER